MDDSNKDGDAGPSGRGKSINISRQLSVHSDHSELMERINVIDDDGVPRTITRNVFIPGQVEAAQPRRRRTLSERQGEAERQAYQIYLQETGGSPRRHTDPIAGGDEAQRRRHSIAEVRAREQQERESRAMRQSQREISMVQEPDKAKEERLNECKRLLKKDDPVSKSFSQRNVTLLAERERAETQIEDEKELTEFLEYLNDEYQADVIVGLDNIRAKAEEKYQNERQILMLETDDPEVLQDALDFLDQEYRDKLKEIDEYANTLDRRSPLGRPREERQKPKRPKRSVSIAALEPVAGPSRQRERSPSTVTLARNGSMASSRSTVRDLDTTKKSGRKTPSRHLSSTKRSRIPRTASQKYLPGTDIIGQKAKLRKVYKDEVERTMREVQDGNQQTQLLKSLKKAMKRRFARLENREREERRLKKKYIAELDEARANLSDPVLLVRKVNRLKDEFLSNMDKLAKEAGGMERDRRLLDEKEIRGELAREGKTPAKTPARTPRVPARSARSAAIPTPAANRVLETRRKAADAARSKSRASASSRRPSASSRRPSVAPSRASVTSMRSAPPVTPAASRVLDAKRKAATAARTAVRAAPRPSRRAETTVRRPRPRSTTSQPQTLTERRNEARKKAAAASRATASERRASAAPSRSSVTAAKSVPARQPAESRVQAARRAAAAATRTTAAPSSRRPPSGAPSGVSIRSVPAVTPSAKRIQDARKAAAAASRSTARTAPRTSAAPSRTSVRSVPATTPAASRIQDSRRAAAAASRAAAKSARRPSTGAPSRTSLASARSAPARTPAANRMQEARRAAAAASRSAATRSTHRRPQAASTAASRASMLSGRGAPTPSASRVQQARQAASQAGRSTARRPAASRSRASVAPARSVPSIAPSGSRIQEARRKAAEASRRTAQTAPRPRRAVSAAPASARAAPSVSRMEDARRRAASASRSKAALARSTGRRRRLDPERERYLQMQSEQAPGARKASEKYLAGTDLVKLRAKAKQEYQKAVKRAKDTIQGEAELADRLQDLEENYRKKLKKINSFDADKAKLKMKYLEDLKRLRDANASEEEITDLRENLKDDLEALDREVGADVRLEPITDRQIERDVQRFKMLAQKAKEARTPKPPKTVARKASEKYVGATDLVKLRTKAKQDYAKSVQDAKNLIQDENELKNHLEMLRNEYAKKLKQINNLDANKIKLKAKYLEDLKRARDAGADQDALNDIRNELQEKLERLEREAGVPQRRLTPINERDIKRELDRHKTLAETLKSARTPKPQPKRPPGTAKERQALLAPTAPRPATSRTRRSTRKLPVPPTVKPEPKVTQANVNILKKKAKEEFDRQSQVARAEIDDEEQYARKVEALKAELASKLHFIRNMDKYKGTVYQKYQKDIRNAMNTIEDKDVLKERLDYLKERYTMRIDHINEMAGMPRRPLARSPDAEIRDEVNKTIRNLEGAASRRPSQAAVGAGDSALGAHQRPVTPAGRPTRQMRPRRLSSVTQFSQDDISPPRTAKRPPAKKMVLKKRGELDPRLQKFLEERRGPPKPKALMASERYPLVAQLNYLKGVAKQQYLKEIERAHRDEHPRLLDELLEFLKYEYKARLEFIDELPDLKKTEEDKYDAKCSEIRAQFADSPDLQDHLRLAKEEYTASIARLMKTALGRGRTGRTKFDELTNRLIAHPTRTVRDLPQFVEEPPKLSAVFHTPGGPVAGPSGLQRAITPALMAKKTTTPVKSLAKPRTTAKKPEATSKRPSPKIKTKSARDASMALEKSAVEPKTSEWRVPASARHLIRQKKAIEEGIAQLSKKTKNNKELLQRLDQTEQVDAPISEASLAPMARDIGLGTSKQEVRDAMKVAKQLGAVAKRRIPPTAAKAAQKKDPIGVSPLEAEEADNIFKMMMDETEGVDLKKDPKEVVKLKVPSDAPKLAVIGNAVESLSRGVITNKIPVKEINVLSAKTAEDFASVVRQQPKSRFPNQSIAAKRIRPTKEKPADGAEEGAEGGADESASAAPALQPSTKLRSDFLECELTLNSYQVETFFQARGSMLPKWFPGVYTVYPEDSPKLVMKKSPSEILQRAWETMKPKFKGDRRPTP